NVTHAYQQQSTTTRFPYTTLFRSRGLVQKDRDIVRREPPHSRRLGLLDAYPGGRPDRLAYPGRACGIQTAPRFHDDRSVDDVARSESTRLNSSHDQISYAVFCL